MGVFFGLSCQIRRENNDGGLLFSREKEGGILYFSFTRKNEGFSTFLSREMEVFCSTFLSRERKVAKESE